MCHCSRSEQHCSLCSWGQGNLQGRKKETFFGRTFIYLFICFAKPQRPGMPIGCPTESDQPSKSQQGSSKLDCIWLCMNLWNMNLERAAQPKIPGSIALTGLQVSSSPEAIVFLWVLQRACRQLSSCLPHGCLGDETPKQDTPSKARPKDGSQKLRFWWIMDATFPHRQKLYWKEDMCGAWEPWSWFCLVLDASVSFLGCGGSLPWEWEGVHRQYGAAEQWAQALGAPGIVRDSHSLHGKLPWSCIPWKPRCLEAHEAHPACVSGKSPLKLPPSQW